MCLFVFQAFLGKTPELPSGRLSHFCPLGFKPLRSSVGRESRALLVSLVGFWKVFLVRPETRPFLKAVFVLLNCGRDLMSW